MEPRLLQQMRSEWNARAADDAYYYVAFGRRNQDEREFFETADEVLAWLENELRRVEAPVESRRALEIGCGPGRLMRPLSTHFAEIHGVDVSDAMIRRAEQNLAAIPHAHVHATSGADLAPFADSYFDFVYSYAVFQHIPSSEVVIQYLREAARVLKPNGILVCQINGLPEDSKPLTTWAGARIPAERLVSLARELNCQMLELSGSGGQYMATTWRKRTPDWQNGCPDLAAALSIVQVEPPEIPAGRGGQLKVTVEGMNPDCDLADLSGTIHGQPARVFLISHPTPDGTAYLMLATAPLPQTAAARVELFWRGRPVRGSAVIAVAAPEKRPPVLVSVTDGINYLSGRRITSRFVKIFLDEVTDPDGLTANVDGIGARCARPFCVDPQRGRYELNVFLPRKVGPGRHRLNVLHGGKALPVILIDVGLLQAPDVFRGVPDGARLLEIGDQATAIPDGVMATDPTRLPFGRGVFTGISLRHASGQWGETIRELSRVVHAEGALYVEVPSAANLDLERFVKDTEAALGMPCRWRRELARPLTSGLPEGLRALGSLGRRLADRVFGTRLGRGGIAFYFGRQWNEPDLRPRLNGCVGCGRVYAEAEISAAGTTAWRLGLRFYLCPACGAPNVLTLDR